MTNSRIAPGLGKKNVKCTGTPRPALNIEKLQTLERLVLLKTGITKEEFIKKFENMQKGLRSNKLIA
jgi:hypothetical protein